MLSKASEILQNNEKALIYNYYLDPDSSLHRSGTKHEKISRICREINKKINKIAHDNPDTLIIVFADHSHIDVKPLFIDELEELNECVTNIYAIEPRAATFKIKEGKENKDIKCILSEEGITLSLRTIQRYTKEYKNDKIPQTTILYNIITMSLQF